MNKRKLENVVELYMDGHSVSSIAKQFGSTREAVYRYLREIPNFKDISRKFSEDKKELRLRRYTQQIEEIISLRKSGISMSCISKELGISYKRVRELLKNTEYDNSHSSKEFRNSLIYTTHKSGLTQKEIALKLGLGQSTVSKIIRKWETSHKT
jgi:transposase